MSSRLRQAMRSQQGYTLIEVVVMTAIVTIGIISTLVVAHLTLNTSQSNEDRVAGTNLAREGIELTRAIRDSNWAFQARVQAGEVAPPSAAISWDCYVSSAGQQAAVPPGCDGHFRTNSTPVNYAIVPKTGNGVPYVIPQASSNTRDPVYLICPAQIPGGGVAPADLVYTPVAAANPCPIGGTPFYRRITVQRVEQKDPGGNYYKVKVTASVNWPARKSGDIIIETYLTDWRSP